MGLTSLILLFMLALAFILAVAGIVLHSRNVQNRPSLLGVIALLLQVLLLILFFTDTLTNLNEAVFDILWWVTVICGLIFGIIEVKNNIMLAMLNIFLSILLAVVMLLLLFITSM